MNPPGTIPPLDTPSILDQFSDYPMEEPDPIPTGRLNNVRRTWDYQGGWVRAPLNEIMFNKRLTKQARLLWLWLSWVRPDSRNISWADCEDTMCCGTKARRLCLSQLVQEGFVTVQEDGIVILHDPYKVYRKTHDETITQIKKEFRDFDSMSGLNGCSSDKKIAVIDDGAPSSEEVSASFEELNASFEEVFVENGAHYLESSDENVLQKTKQFNKTNKSLAEKDKRADIAPGIISTWNTCKPDSYAKIRTLSAKQLEAINKHLRNLSLKQSELIVFLETVCKGIYRSDFWSTKVHQSGRNFSSVFGYGNPHDTKLKNVENLYMLGQEDLGQDMGEGVLTDDQKELLKSYKYINFEFQKARNRNNQNEITKWQENLDAINQQLEQQGISIESIEVN